MLKLEKLYPSETMIKFDALINLARPHQYVKNGFIFLPLLFGYKLFDPYAIMKALVAFAAFCFAASSVYVVNDLKDIPEDRQHPVKRFRPLASGAVKPNEAIVFGVFLVVLSIALGSTLFNVQFLSILGGYLVLNLVYSFKLKHIAIIDAVCIAIGFVLRVFAGGIVVDVWPNHWIVLMTFLLALFLAIAKRRDDLVIASNGNGSTTRRSLDGYNLEFVSTTMSVLAAVVVVCYVLYTVSPETIMKHGTSNLYISSFWVILGMLRYMQVTFVDQKSGSPTAILAKDPMIRCSIVLWVVSIVAILYFK